jgi:phosphoenolpyruvate-protein kinase (PTS system EI component)
VAREAHKKGKWVGMCGEMAGDVMTTPLLIGLGLTELSMSARAVPAVKYRIRQIDVEQAKVWADHIVNLRTTAEIKQCLEEISATFEK